MLIWLYWLRQIGIEYTDHCLISYVCGKLYPNKKGRYIGENSYKTQNMVNIISNFSEILPT